MGSPDYALLREFRNLFAGKPYLHRNSSLGDWVASFLYEDLFQLQKSEKLHERILSATRVLNAQNRTVGILRRRGDGTFGELVPVATPLKEEGFAAARGPVATIEIGVETKILAKAMIKQIDRVIGDLVRQTEEFKRRGGQPLCIALVGVNFAEQYTSFEGTQSWPTDGKKYKHPIQEANDAILRLRQRAFEHFDEHLVLKFKASNSVPFPFAWVNENEIRLEYSALLTRISRKYDQRFA
jgi:hypothetical protein